MAPTNEDIGKQIADGIAQGISAIAPRKRKTVAEVDTHSPFHPNKKDTKQFRKGRVYSQNNARLAHSTTSDEEIVLLNQIEGPGSYCDGLVTVAIERRGNKEHVDIQYSNNTIDKRIELMKHYRNFKELLEIIVRDQKKAA